MTKADIETRIAVLQKQAHHLQANLDAVTGAIQDCQYWLTTIETSAESVEPSNE